MVDMPKVAVLFGFGINCDHETKAVFDLVGGQATRIHVNHFINGNRSLEEFQILAVPGGFSFGDHLGSGRLLGNRMRFALREQLHAFVAAGKPIIGICNGFQILLESGLLPGALMQNHTRKFICKNVYVRVESTSTPFTQECQDKSVLDIPIAHHQGSYYIDPHSLGDMEERGQVLFRYCDAKGNITESSNPNGSVGSVAGICNEQKNVMGMMPHPERCSDPLWTNTDGQSIFKSLIAQS